MTSIAWGRPLTVHEPFHKSPARFRCNFGAAGSGKSYAGCDEVIAWMLEQPGIEGMITRVTAPELRDTTERVFQSRVPAELWNASRVRRAGGHLESVTFPNGSRALFRSMDDWQKHKSLNLGFLFFDEMTEFSEEDFHGMRMRLRQTDPTPEARDMGYRGRIRRTGAWGSTNPNGKDWCYHLFHPDGKRHLKDSAAFFSTTLDNPYLSPEYVDDLVNMPQQYVLRYVLCQFDDFAGRIYETFGQRNIIPHPNVRDIAGGVVWMGMDPGTRNPTAGVWAWVDTANNRLVAIAEYEQPGLSVEAHAAAWRRIELSQQMRVQWRVADPNSITQRSRETMISLQTAYGRLGYHFTLGASRKDDRIWQLGRLITAGRFVVSENCAQLIDKLRNYQWKDVGPAARAKGEDAPEEPLKNGMDLVEAAQYVSGRFLPLDALQYRKPKLETMSDLIWNDVRQNLQRPREGRMITSDLGISQ